MTLDRTKRIVIIISAVWVAAVAIALSVGRPQAFFPSSNVGTIMKEGGSATDITMTARANEPIESSAYEKCGGWPEAVDDGAYSDTQTLQCRTSSDWVQMILYWAAALLSLPLLFTIAVWTRRWIEAGPTNFPDHKSGNT